MMRFVAVSGNPSEPRAFDGKLAEPVERNQARSDRRRRQIGLGSEVYDS